jgi:Putative binding domain, N-terminal
MNFVQRAKAALVAVALLLWPIAADAQLSKVGAPFVTPGGASAYSLTSETEYDSAHQVFLTVVAEQNTAPGGRINASFANTNGTVVSTAFRVDSTANWPFGPAMAYSPEADVFLVVWSIGGGQVRGRLVRYGANALGSVDFAVSGTGVASGAWAPAVAYSPTSQEFLVAYAKGGTRIARVSTAGAVIGQPVLASVPAASGYHWTESPSLAWNPTNNEFLLTYAQELSPGWQIRAHRISAGQLVGGIATVHAAGSTKMPDVQYSSQAGKYLVTWFQGNPYGIYGRLLNADATVATAPQPMLPSNYGSYDANSLGYNSFSHKFAVATITPQSVAGVGWRDTIGGAEVSTAAVPSTPMRYVEADSGNRFFPEIAGSSTNNRFLVSFNKSHATFYGQILATGGGSEPPPPPPPNCTYSLSAASASVASVGGGGSLTVTTNTSPCGWTVSSNGAWLTASPGSGTTTGNFTWTAQPNGTGAPRSATLSIAGQVFTVSQSGPPGLALRFDQESYGAVLAYTPSTGNWATLLGQGSGLVAGPSGTWNPGWKIQAARFNGDDLADFFYYNETTGAWRKGINNGGSLTYHPGDFGPGWDTTVIDLNGDGLSDVFLYYSPTGAWNKCISTSEQGFTCSAGSPSWAPGWKIYPAKFNGDAYGDLFLYNPSGGWAGLWFKVLGQAGSSFTFVAGDVRWASDWQVTPGDFDGDGFTDVLLYRTADGMVFRVKFTASSATYVSSYWGTTWTMHKGDFNGDRKTDLLLYEPTSTDGRWAVGLSNAAGWFDFYYPPGGAGVGWIPHVGHLNGDAKSDIVWYRPADGMTVAWYPTTPGMFNYLVGPTIQTGANLVSSPPTIP